MQKSIKSIQIDPFSLVQKEKEYRNHVKRMVAIAGDKKIYTEKQKIISEHDARFVRNQEIKKREKNKKQLEIQKDNERMLGTLIKISFKRNAQKNPVNGNGSTQGAETFRHELGKESPSKSLNYVSRKQDILRILNENAKLTEKIVSQGSSLSKGKLDRQYQKNKEYGDRIRKLRVSQDHTSKIGHSGLELSKNLRVKSQDPYLPPLSSTSLTRVYPAVTYRGSLSKSQSRPSASGSISFRSHFKDTEFYHVGSEKPSVNSQVNSPVFRAARNKSVADLKSQCLSLSGSPNIKSNSEFKKLVKSELKLSDPFSDIKEIEKEDALDTTSNNKAMTDFLQEGIANELQEVQNEQKEELQPEISAN